LGFTQQIQPSGEPISGAGCSASLAIACSFWIRRFETVLRTRAAKQLVSRPDKNPHESKHTFGEVQGWFKENGFEFMNSIPKAQARVLPPTK